MPPPTAWADDELLRVVAQALADGGGAQEVTRAVRASLRAHLALVLVDPRCDVPTRAVLEEWISGRPRSGP